MQLLIALQSVYAELLEPIYLSSLQYDIFCIMTAYGLFVQILVLGVFFIHWQLYLI